MNELTVNPVLNRFDAAGFIGHRVLSPEYRHEQWRYAYENGYGASVVIGDYTYGGDAGLFEVAVMHPNTLCYATPVTSDVIGHLDESAVLTILDQIRDLPTNDNCDHGRAVW